MSRSKRYSGKSPHLIEEALEIQQQNGILNYPSANARRVGQDLYQALYGGQHWITEAISRMGPDDQDCIHDFALWLNQNGLTMGGQFLRRVADRAAAGEPEPDSHELPRRSAGEILELARRVANGEGETVANELKA